jgi:hypothetical protein
MTSGKLDFGMFAVVDTCICRACKAIVDVSIGEMGKVYTKKELAAKLKRSGSDSDFYTCPKCGSDKDLVKWNKRTRPCPKCDGKMIKDKHGPFALWD